MIKTVTYVDNLVIKETVMLPYSVTTEENDKIWEVRSIDGHVSSFNPSRDFSVSAKFKTQQEADSFYKDLTTPFTTIINNNSTLVRNIVS
jgi:hypothetical protein